jgi:uncharacterized LabA/DUF88 family protein
MNRVAFVVDGFNVFHSLLEAQATLGRQVKWLHLRSLCEAYARRSVFGQDSSLHSVTYFSAYATFLASSKPRALDSHRHYVRALRATGVEVILGRFKARWRRCSICGKAYVTHEEKETDVAIAVWIVELAISGDCDSIVVVTGDTDILPAMRAARRLAPDKQLCVASPFRRYNRELRHHAHLWFKIRPEAYRRHQLPNPVVAPHGVRIYKPDTW